jgi:hypothetical protein
MLNMAEPATKTQSTVVLVRCLKGTLQKVREIGSLTEQEDDSKDLATNLAKHLETSIIDCIHLGMIPFEDTNHVIRPSSYGTDRAEAHNARDDAELVECHGNTENTKADLGLHHEGDSGNPAKLQLLVHVHGGYSMMTIGTYTAIVGAIL